MSLDYKLWMLAAHFGGAVSYQHRTTHMLARDGKATTWLELTLTIQNRNQNRQNQGPFAQLAVEGRRMLCGSNSEPLAMPRRARVAVVLRRAPPNL